MTTGSQPVQRHEEGGKTPPPKPPASDKERRAEVAKEQAAMEKAADDAAYRRATQGPDDEMKEKIIALGGDASRASPAIEQNLGDPQPGVTTTTGAYRSPIDPTTADVPADPDSDFVRRAPRGFAALGKGKGDRGGPRDGKEGKPQPDTPPTSHTNPPPTKR